MLHSHIEQAIFTSARTHHTAGYHLVTASNGLSEADRQLLTTLAPAHDALAQGREISGSFSYWQFPNDRYCLAESRLSGREYSGRGERLYTSLFIVPHEIWERFAGNPFAIRRAIRAKGQLRVREDLLHELSPISLPGRAIENHNQYSELLRSMFDEATTAQVFEQLNQDTGLLLVDLVDNEKVIEAIVGLLPFGERSRITFSTGLRYAACRATKIVCGESLDQTLRKLEQEGKYFKVQISGQLPVYSSQ